MIQFVVLSLSLCIPSTLAFTFLPSVIGPRSKPLFLLPDPSSLPSSTPSSSSSPCPFENDHDHEDYHLAHNDRRDTEFMNLEPLEETEIRRQRIEQDTERRAKFVEFGDKLWELRSKMDKLTTKMVHAIHSGEEELEQYTRQQLKNIERRDPELVYMLELSDMELAHREGRDDDAARHRENALAARSCLTHFNLEGLWVGKYGAHGYELINVTYVADTLIASKVTGDRNVPKGEITFKVDLHPLRYRTKKGSSAQQSSQQLQPIVLTDKAAKKWGTRKLPRYAGLGQVAEEGFRNHQWMDGQLIIIGDDYFSFAWIPIEQQIFFGRPSPELALKMLRDYSALSTSLSNEFATAPSVHDDIQVQKKYVMRCLSKTHEVEDERSLDGDAFGCIWDDAGSDECYLE